MIVLAVLLLIAVNVALAFWLRAALRGDGQRVPPSGAADARASDARLTEPRVTGEFAANGSRESATGPGRRNDDFRSFQAVAGEVAKRQVAVLADVAAAVQAYERACFVHVRRLCELMAGEFRRAGVRDLPDAMPKDLDSAMRLLELWADKPLDEAANHRIRKDLEPNVTVLLSYGQETTSLLEENRFWLGMALERELHDFVSGMGTAFADVSGHPDQIRLCLERYAALVSEHPEASRAIDRLSTRSGTPSMGTRTVN